MMMKHSAVHEGTVDAVWLKDQGDYAPAPALAKDETFDVAIIGGGFTGMSCAYHLSERFPERRIAILEAHTLASGASGRNGGMVATTIAGLYPSDPQLYKKYYDLTLSGIELIAGIIQRHGLRVQLQRRGTVELYTSAASAEEAAKEIESRRDVGVPEYYLPADKAREWLAVDGLCGASVDPNGGQLNGARYVRELRPVVEARGVRIYENTPVLAVHEGKTITLRTPQATVRAAAIVLGTNAYTPRLGYFKNQMFALHSHVVATEARPHAEWAELGWRQGAAFNDDRSRLSYGSLTEDGHLVFGGGSNASYAYLFGNRMAYRKDLGPGSAAVAAQLRTYFPRAKDLRIAHRWTGALGITATRVCAIGVRGEHHNVYYGVGYSGMGVVMSNLAGKILCDAYSDDDARWREYPFYCRAPYWIPPEPFRWLGYQAYTKLTGRSPRRAL